MQVQVQVLARVRVQVLVLVLDVVYYPLRKRHDASNKRQP